MYLAWINTVRKQKFEYDPAANKFVCKTISVVDLGHVFIPGFVTNIYPKSFVFCEFAYPQKTEELEFADTGVKLLPGLSIKN